MIRHIKHIIICILLTAPFFCLAQATTGTEKKDTMAKAAVDSLPPKTDSVKAVDSVKQQVDTVEAPKDCYKVWYEFMRTRGAKKVTDGMQQVVIALKSEEECHCFLGQIEVVAGKIKPPLYIQQENGEYRPISVVGKKLDAGFATAMGDDQLFAISEGMSIVFRTASQEYGRLFFYKFANKGAQSNKVAPSPSELIKE